ncbi:MAG: hypothetical protein QXQ02_08110 [Halobacteria archaeon]
MRTGKLTVVMLLVLVLCGALIADVCEQAEREMARTDELITEAEPTIMGSGNEEAIALFEQGVELQEEARSLYSEGNCAGAMRTTHQARALVRRALALVAAGGAIPDSVSFPFPGRTPSPEMVERYLRETDEIIAREEPGIRESGNPLAIELLERAIELQSNAWDEYRAGHYPRAFMLSRQARTLVERAVRIVHTSPGIPPVLPGDSVMAARELERTDALIEEYRDTILSSGDSRAIELFTRGVELEAEAHSAFDEGRYRDAVRLTLEARSLVIRAYRILSRPTIDSSFVRAALERTDALIERARSIISSCTTSEAVELFNEAVATQARAYDAYASGRYGEALRLTMLARSLVLRAIRLCSGSVITPIEPSDSAMVSRELARTDEIIAAVTPGVMASGNPDAIRTLNEAQTHQEAAYEYFDSGEYREALGETRIARQLACRAAMMAGVPLPPGCSGGGMGPGGW